MNRHHLLGLIVAMMFVLTGCADDIGAAFDIVLFSASDDPETRKIGEMLVEVEIDKRARVAADTFLATGDRRHLDEAIVLRPNDTGLRAFEVALATLDGDPAKIEAAQQALAEAEARRLAPLFGPGDPPLTAAKLRRNVLGEILVAQIRMLGGSVTEPWDAPGPEASAKDQRLFADFCATRREIQTRFDDSLSYIPLPPCPGS